MHVDGETRHNQGKQTGSRRVEYIFIMSYHGRSTVVDSTVDSFTFSHVFFVAPSPDSKFRFHEVDFCFFTWYDPRTVIEE
jgi:hypothetical protein